MPELPEVETTRRGLEPHLTGQTILRLTIHDHRLRWPVDARLPQTLAGQRVESVDRRVHIDLILTSGHTVRFNDPRRFGSVIYVIGDPQEHPLLAKLAPEPFD